VTSATSCRASRRRIRCNQTLVELIGDFAKQKNATPAQIPWHGAGAEAMDCAIPAQRNCIVWKRISAASVELSVDDNRRLTEATSKSRAGARYPETLQKLVGR